MHARCNLGAAGFYANHADLFIAQKVIEKSDGIGTAAHTSNHHVGQALFRLKNLTACFAPDNGLEIPAYHGKRMGTVNGAQDVMGTFHIGCPVTERFIDRVLERP